MKNKIPKVLMLGWEFPPLINGGLGIACHDLSLALSEFVKVTMIIPKSNVNFSIRNLELIGLNNIDITSLQKDIYNVSYKSLEGVSFVPVDLNPYYSEFASEASLKNIKDISYSKNTFEKFDIDNLYNGDVIGKVLSFTGLATNLASTLDFDIIHAHDWMTMLAGIAIKALTGKPLILHIHSLAVDRDGTENRGWVFEIEKLGMQHADLLIPVSNFTGENIHKYYEIPKNKIAVIHNGIRKVDPFKTRKNFSEKIVLFIGRLTRQKGPEIFLEIASKILDKNPNVRFVMAGTGDYFRQLIEQSSYKHIGNRFHMTGFLDTEKVKYLLSISDVYCMPSVSEPFGLSAVEAVQFGVPCVISKQSGVSEVLSGALKFDFWDVNKAAEYVLSLLSDSVLREKVVKDANENLRNISWGISAKKVIQAYQIFSN